MIEAEYTGANSLVCVLGERDFTQVDYMKDASVSVLWSGPDIMYSLETGIDPLNGITCTLLIVICVYLSILNSDIV